MKQVNGISGLSAVCALALGASNAHAHLHNVLWDVFPDGSPILNNTPITDQFNMWGAMYSGDVFVVRNDDEPDAISGPNTVFLSNKNDPTLPAICRIQWVFHGTTIPSVCNFIGITAIDAASPETVFTMKAYDSEGEVIAEQSTLVENTHQFDPFEDEEIVFFAENIIYVEFIATAPAGQVVNIELDNLRYNHIIPAPASAAALLGGVAVLGRRRRR